MKTHLGYEDGRVTISRATGSVTFPCHFMLIAAMNPSPSGVKSENLSAQKRYLDRISRPLLDRFDIHCEVPAVKFSDLSAKAPGEPSSRIRERVVAARERQRARFSGSRTFCNAQMSSKQLREHCKLQPEVEELLKMAMNELSFSARAHDRILKVARTIADLAGAQEIETAHISEAIQYRTLDRTLWQ